LDTIAHGLAPNETAYSWVVPDIAAESCYIVAMAYGPGWQYDENETAFSIGPVGASENRPAPIHETKLIGSIPSPLRGPARVRFQLKSEAPVRLDLRDVTGRVVSALAGGVKASGVYDVTLDAHTLAQGVYFLSFDTPDHHETRKVVKTW
jgi:hypothetical protein